MQSRIVKLPPKIIFTARLKFGDLKKFVIGNIIGERN